MSWNGILSRELKTSGTAQRENAVTANTVTPGAGTQGRIIKA